MEDDRYTRITLRIPKDLHAKLQASADDNSKSINSEIVNRLDDSFYDLGPRDALRAMTRLEYRLAEAELRGKEGYIYLNYLAHTALQCVKEIFRISTNLDPEAIKALHELDALSNACRLMVEESAPLDSISAAIDNLKFLAEKVHSLPAAHGKKAEDPMPPETSLRLNLDAGQFDLPATEKLAPKDQTHRRLKLRGR